jgi:hypothetical protein
MRLINEIKKSVNPSSDYIFKEIKISNRKVYLIFNEILTDTGSINKYILFELIRLNKNKLNDLENNINCCSMKKINKKDIINYLNNGYVIIIYKDIYACEVKANLSRSISEIDSERSINGSKDSNTENFNTNLGLIRKRLKTDKLKVINKNIGKYSNTKVGILYIEGIVKGRLYKEVSDKLDKIDIDGIIDSSYLKKSLETKFNLFPTIITTERPDKCSMALLEGKIVIIVDNSPYSLILPSLFLDFFHTTDDYYQKSFNATFIRIIRLIAFFMAIFTPAIYISITTRNYNLVPLPLLLMLKAGRTFVPFPAYIEALFMIICFEILKESDLRMSTTGGSAVSILGGLILGDAAVSAGIVSPIMIIVIAISSIAGLVFNSIELVNVQRTYKIFILILSTILGIYGVFIGFIILLYNIFSTRVFGYKYLEFDKNEVFDSIIKIDRDKCMRNSKLTNNIVRGRYK